MAGAHRHYLAGQVQVWHLTHRRWTESLAVGSKEYIEVLQKQLAVRAKGREVSSVEGGCQLRENETDYRRPFEGEKGGLSPENTFFWNPSLDPTMS